MNAASSLNDHIRQLEQQLLRPEVRRSANELASLLADEFVEFASDGNAYTKTDVIAALQHEAAHVWSIRDFRLAVLADDAVLATYRAAKRHEPSGEVVKSLRSSVWTLRNNRWQLLFHQGTRVGP